MHGLLLLVFASFAVVKSDDLIDEFNDPSTGIGFTMIPQNVWERAGKGNNGMDAAGFYPLEGMYEYHKDAQQAVSIVTKDQDMNPYDGGYGTYGLAFHVTEETQFWKYFQVAQVKGTDVIVGGPGDGANHIPPSGYWRKTILQVNKSYDWFKQQKNSILARYNTVYHNHDYNEFDTNGLSPDGFAGVFVNEQWKKPGPDKATMCRFLTHANPNKTTWPVYGYKWHNLTINEYLKCDAPAPSPPPVGPTGCAGVTIKRDCGFNGISEAQCKAKGCCWAPGAGSEPWCFHSNGIATTLNAAETILV